MFKFPYEWLREDSEIDTDFERLLAFLALQGFEIASIEEVEGDRLIEIEVKANRPDMLSVAGVLREYYSDLGAKQPKEYTVKTDLQFSDGDILSRQICVNSSDVHEYCAVEIEGVDNTRPTPDFVASRLKKLGVESINPLVDIGNYILFWLGQPIHIFDRDKVEGAIKIENAKKPFKFVTLSGSEIEVPKGALVISDQKKPLCLAGIIGGKDAAVTRDTKNIIIESANFDHIIVRTVGKKLRISTTSSYRFERGVARKNAIIGAGKTADMIADICGGRVKTQAYRFCGKSEGKEELLLSAARVNAVLGVCLTASEIADILKKCFFHSKVQGDILAVSVPWFRLDIEDDVDLIEEVGRIYGYHNIEPKPVALRVPEVKNIVNQNSAKLRNHLVGFGFVECLNYGFIPGDAMKVLSLSKGDTYFGDITITNPLSNQYSLMRPTLAYGLVATAINNMKRGIQTIKIFEIGKTFFREGDYTEKNVVAGLLSGTKYKKGFGQSKEAKYTVFDAVSLVESVTGEFCDVSIKNSDAIKFLEEGSAAQIFAGKTLIGCVGKISPKVLGHFDSNVVKDDLFYFEFDFDAFGEKRREIRHESNFPTVKREYNFLVKSGVHFADYKEVFSHELITAVTPVDVYLGQGVPKGMSSVLISVSFNSPSRTLESGEIDQIEKDFKQALRNKYGIELKV